MRCATCRMPPIIRLTRKPLNQHYDLVIISAEHFDCCAGIEVCRCTLRRFRFPSRGRFRNYALNFALY